MNEMHSVEVANMVNILNYTIRRLEYAVQHEQEDIIKSAGIAFASGVLWSSDVARMGRGPVFRSVSVGASLPESADRSIIPVVMENEPLEAEGVEPAIVVMENGPLEAEGAEPAIVVMENGPLEAEGAEPAIVGPEPISRSVSVVVSTPEVKDRSLTPVVMETESLEAEDVDLALEHADFSDIEVIESILPDHVIDLSQDTDSDSSGDSNIDELEFESMDEDVDEDIELRTLRNAPLHRRKDICASVKADCTKLWRLLREYEDMRSGCKRENLNANTRPAEILDWIQRKRRPLGGPKKLDRDSFGIAWREWWWNINPKWRRGTSPQLRFVAATDLSLWAALDKGGQTGIRIAVMSLFWWIPDTAIDVNSSWANYVLDICFVLEDIIRLRNVVIRNTLCRASSSKHTSDGLDSKSSVRASISSASAKKRNMSVTETLSSKKRQHTP